MLRFAPLGSGSEGNALVVEAGADSDHPIRVLLDCGLALKECCRRLQLLGLSGSDLSAIVVTHEHSDHVGGVFKLARRFNLPVFLTHGTLRASEKNAFDCTVNIICSHTAFTLGDLTITPHPVPHDAREPVQFTFTKGERKLAVLTDLGTGTPHVRAMLSGSHVIVMECNHDTDLLAASDYPLYLKNRIAGSLGHLSNQAAAEILASCDLSRLKRLLAAHLSQKNNTPSLVRQSLAGIGGLNDRDIEVLEQHQVGQWIEV